MHCTVCVATYELTTSTWPKWQRIGARAKSLPINVTSEPPLRGPAVGRSAARRAAARYWKCAALPEKSTTLLLTWTATMRGKLAPALSPAIAGTAQTSTDELRHTAWLVVSLKRQSRYERSAERDEKCAPISVTGVPPKMGPALGVTERTTAAAWYSKARCPVAAAAAAEPIVEATPSATTPGGRAGVTHRTRDREIHNADDAPERPKWHANEASRDMSAPSTVSSVPPSSGPSVGCMLRIVGPRYEKRTSSCVKSRPFIVSWTCTSARLCGGDTHSITCPETSRAALSERPNRQSMRPSAPARAENGPPRSATSVPPPTGP